MPVHDETSVHWLKGLSLTVQRLVERACVERACWLRELSLPTKW